MFEEYINKNEERLLGAINTSRGFLFLREIIKNAAIDSATKAYFAAEVEWWIYEEQLARKANRNFDLNDPDLQSSLFELDAFYRQNAKFNIDDLKETFSSAVRARLNFLVRPRTALTWFVFRGEQTKPFGEIMKRLEYFSEYKYFYDGMLRWAETNNFGKNSVELLPVNDFRNIIESIDNEAIYDLTPEEFIELMSPLFEFFNIETDGEPVLPTEAVAVYMDDKQVMPISQRFKEMLIEEGIRFVDKKLFIDTIYQMIDEIENPDEGIIEDDDSSILENANQLNEYNPEEEIFNSSYEKFSIKSEEENESMSDINEYHDVTDEFSTDISETQEITGESFEVPIDEEITESEYESTDSNEQADIEMQFSADNIDNSTQLYKRNQYSAEDIESAAQSEIDDILNDIDSDEDISYETEEYESSDEFQKLEEEFENEFSSEFDELSILKKNEIEEFDEVSIEESEEDIDSEFDELSILEKNEIEESDEVSDMEFDGEIKEDFDSEYEETLDSSEVTNDENKYEDDELSQDVTFTFDDDDESLEDETNEDEMNFDGGIIDDEEMEMALLLAEAELVVDHNKNNATYSENSDISELIEDFDEIQYDDSEDGELDADLDEYDTPVEKDEDMKCFFCEDECNSKCEDEKEFKEYHGSIENNLENFSDKEEFSKAPLSENGENIHLPEEEEYLESDSFDISDVDDNEELEKKNEEEDFDINDELILNDDFDTQNSDEPTNESPDNEFENINFEENFELSDTSTNNYAKTAIGENEIISKSASDEIPFIITSGKVSPSMLNVEFMERYK